MTALPSWKLAIVKCSNANLREIPWTDGRISTERYTTDLFQANLFGRVDSLPIHCPKLEHMIDSRQTVTSFGYAYGDAKMPSSKASVTRPPAFEWITHGDASACKRTRAHVTRGFRREKAEKAMQIKALTKDKLVEILPIKTLYEANYFG
ncbi:hypothetical protein B0O99DRAFT_688435 [Bisporella sp. PMI_857]|nr:hypothetical protein B0O99DRAFT_688435 [Bisporella sp. PMI_857]